MKRAQHSQTAIEKKLSVTDYLFCVTLCGNVVIGTALSRYDGRRGWLYSVAVHPAYRRRGLGAKLVYHAEVALTMRGCMKINLQIVSTNESVKNYMRSWEHYFNNIFKRYSISMGSLVY